MLDTRKGLNTHYKVQSRYPLLAILGGKVLELTVVLNYFSAGVMRFLQTEWHRHERDRNAWQIERAEMKSRIGKLEGDGRTSKRLQESLGKHVKILENALKKEREKAKASTVEGQSVEKEESEQSKQSFKAASKRRSLRRLQAGRLMSG